MRDVQTCENRCRDSRIYVGVGIDSVRPMWQDTATVPALFVKTGAFRLNNLVGSVKTKKAPPGGNRTRPDHQSIGGSNGL